MYYYDGTSFQTPQVVEGSDSGQQPDIDVTSTDSDGPVETHVSNPQSLHERTKEQPICRSKG